MCGIFFYRPFSYLPNWRSLRPHSQRLGLLNVLCCALHTPFAEQSVNQPFRHYKIGDLLMPQALQEEESCRATTTSTLVTRTMNQQLHHHHVACVDDDTLIIGQTSQSTKDLSDSRGSLSANMMNKPRPVCVVRRCSLDHHARHHQSAASGKDDATISTSSTSLTGTTGETTHRQPRRSSLKPSSSTSRPSSTTPKKHVTFSLDVRVKEIEFRDQDYNQAAWLSKEERQDIQYRAKADLKVIKHLTKYPEDRDTPGFRAVRSNISLRGLEQFISKRIQRCLILEQQDVIYSVLEAQELQLQFSSHFGAFNGPEELAKVSAERSFPSGERALRQGKEDEAAVLSYLGLTSRKKKSADSYLCAERRSSMPAAASSSSPHDYMHCGGGTLSAQASSNSARSLKTL